MIWTPVAPDSTGHVDVDFTLVELAAIERLPRAQASCRLPLVQRRIVGWPVQINHVERERTITIRVTPASEMPLQTAMALIQGLVFRRVDRRLAAYLLNEFDGRTWTQKPQKYHAKSLAALRARYAVAADDTALNEVLESTGCLRFLREAG